MAIPYGQSYAARPAVSFTGGIPAGTANYGGIASIPGMARGNNYEGAAYGLQPAINASMTSGANILPGSAGAGSGNASMAGMSGAYRM